MDAERLKIDRFKNLKPGEVQLCPGVNIFYGDNAQGKTNFLEAVHYFSAGRSFRVPRDRDLIQFGQEGSRLALTFSSRERVYDCQVSLYRDRKKEVLINGVPIQKMAELTGLFCTVLFTPEHLDLIKDGPAMRRKFLDLAICQLRPKYLQVLSEYQRILAQKNSLLKDIWRYPDLRETLEVWNERQAQAGAYLTLMRKSYSEKLEQYAANYQREISGEKEALTIVYQGFQEELPATGQELKELFLERLRESEQEEIDAGSSLLGAHRDDLEICLNGQPARFYASQGQQRSCVLSMKLAEGEAIYQETGEHPVYLFDDILSELDWARQSYVLNQIQGKQVLITCCEPEPFNTIDAGRRFIVREGEIEMAEEKGKPT